MSQISQSVAVGTIDILLVLAPACMAIAAHLPGKEKTVAKQQPQPHREATKNSAAATDVTVVGSSNRYTVVKWTTYLLDYALLIFLFYTNNLWYGGTKWCPLAGAKAATLFFTSILFHDLLKAFLFSDVLAKSKLDHLRALRTEFLELFSAKGIQKITTFIACVIAGEGITQDFKDKSAHRRGVLYHIFYYVKTSLVVVPLAVALQVYIGMFHFSPLMDTVAIVGEGQWWEFKITCLAYVYFEFFAMSFIKDALSMNVFHEIMHRQAYFLHKTHHLPMKELSMVNIYYFDVLDIVIENAVAPAFLLLLKLGLCPGAAGPVSIHWCSYIILLCTDGLIHSISPYSIGFYNPILDSLLKCNISHNLHHALNIGHYTIWPWHQLAGIARYDAHSKQNLDSSIATDMATYNRVFNTNFPED